MSIDRFRVPLVVTVDGALLAVLVFHLVLLARIADAGGADRFSLGDLEFWPAYAGLVGAAVAGSVIALRQPRHPVGWLHLLLATGVAALLFGSSYGVLGVLVRPGSLPGAGHIASATQTLFPIPNTAVALVLLLTPTGTFLSPRWRRVGVVSLVGALLWIVAQLVDADVNGPPLEDVANPFTVEALASVSEVIQIACALVCNGCLALAAYSLIARFRRADLEERRQLLWLALAALWIPVAAFGAMFSVATGHPLLLSLFATSLLALLPLSTLPAVQRYRLYGVERLLSRAVSYVLLTGAVLGAYALVALLVGVALAGLASGSEIAVGVATFVATVLVGPARRRIQADVDRRFNRRRYEAVQIVRRHLEDPQPEVGLERVLATATADPSLRVAYRADQPGTWVSADGQPVVPPEDALVVRRLDDPVAALHWTSPDTSRETVAAAAGEALTELENQRLRSALARQLVELRESRSRIVAAQLAERRALEQNLHDGAQQRLVATTLNLRAALLAESSRPLGPPISEAIEEIRLAVQELREIARELHPSVLTDGGLAASFEDLARRTPIEITFTAGDDRFHPDIEATAWYVACEAVANAIKHGQPSGIDLRASRRDDRLVISVADNGIGGVDPDRGLSSIRDRVETAGGSLQVDSPLGRGTTITVELPCGS